MDYLTINNLSEILQPESNKPYTLLKNADIRINRKEITSFLQFQGTGAQLSMQALRKTLNPHSTHYVTPAFLSPYEKDRTVIHYLAEKQTSKTFIPACFNKSKTESRIRKEVYELHSGLENHLQQKLRELSPDEALLLSVLPFILKKPELLLLDCITTCVPQALHAALLKSLQTLVTLTATTLIFSTRSPQLAFHLSDRIFIFNHENLIQEIDNTEKNRQTLENLFQLMEDNSFIQESL